jgi:transcriptional regulator with XRE-family HTH domain
MDGRRADREAAERLGKNLWMARRRAGYSQVALGTLCALHRTEIGHLEKGRRVPRVDTLMKIAAALDVRVEELLRGIEWTAPDAPTGGSFAVRRGG